MGRVWVEISFSGYGCGGAYIHHRPAPMTSLVVILKKFVFKTRPLTHIYIKGDDWQSYSPSTNSSWYWRKICQVKPCFQEAYQQQLWMNSEHRGYTIAKGYEFVRDKGSDVSGHDLVWNKWTIPKHSFLAWIYHHGNMNTKAKLYRLGISEEDTCCICGVASETIDHLFFECTYNRDILLLVGNWIEVQLPTQNLLNWRLLRSATKVRRGILNATINACMYQVWRQRNLSMHENTLIRPQKVARSIIEEVKMKIKGVRLNKQERKELTWIRRLSDTGA
ncbi:hypothetical protein RND81_01G078400 [Saponaria officinalis]|uniref:Reverse transcriptase zinc-binding domain-containing protein n=1 Tax=Saponaria officinalis TaxID=3572 RepID=A0AAW1NCV9_SAPOF